MKLCTEFSDQAPTVTNDQGGKHSQLSVRLDLLPALAVMSVGKVLAAGAKKYGIDNWKLVPIREHVNHALVHIFGYLAGDVQDHHLQHAACRLLMALDMYEALIPEGSCFAPSVLENGTPTP